MTYNFWMILITKFHSVAFESWERCQVLFSSILSVFFFFFLMNIFKNEF